MMDNFCILFLSSAGLSKITFSKRKIQSGMPSASNSLDPDHYVGPDQVQIVCNGYQQMTKDTTSREHG